MKALRYITAIAAIVALAACQNDDAEFGGYENDPNAVRINAAVSNMVDARSFPTEDIESVKATQFDDAAQILVWADGQEAVTYEYTDTDKEWTPLNQKYLKWNTAGQMFTAYYPAGKYTGMELVPAIQNTATAITAADFMMFEGMIDKPADGAAITLEMKRQTARVVIHEIKWGEQYDAQTHEVESIEFNCNGTDHILPYSKMGKYYALLNPGIALNDNTFITIVVKNKQDGTTKNEIVRGIPALEKGYSYEYGITIGKTEVEINKVEVAPWTDGGIIGNDENMTTEELDYQAIENNGIKTYVVYNESGLKEVNKIITSDVNELSSGIILAAHIVMTGKNNWTPLGNDKNPYTGIFNGNQKTITGLHIDNGTAYYQGLVGKLDGGTVKDLTLAGSTITGSYYVGALVGDVLNGNILNSTVKDCEITGTWCVGGAVATIKKNTTVSDVAMIDSKVTGKSMVGGIVGRTEATSVTIKDCLVQSSIGKSVLITASEYNAGGIAGSFLGELSGCKVINNGELTIITPYRVGGIVANMLDGSVTACLVYGANVTATDMTAGGIVGKSAGSICYSYAYGCTTGETHGTFTGVENVVGENSGSVILCYYYAYGEFEELVRPVPDSSGELSPGTPVDWSTASANMNHNLTKYTWDGTYDAPTLTAM